MRATKPHTPPVTWSCVVTTFRAWSTQLQKLRSTWRSVASSLASGVDSRSSRECAGGGRSHSKLPAGRSVAWGDATQIATVHDAGQTPFQQARTNVPMSQRPGTWGH